ncbi:hypothetical protein ES703_28774 [subsurface metagenome]
MPLHTVDSVLNRLCVLRIDLGRVYVVKPVICDSSRRIYAANTFKEGLFWNEEGRYLSFIFWSGEYLSVEEPKFFLGVNRVNDSRELNGNWLWYVTPGMDEKKPVANPNAKGLCCLAANHSLDCQPGVG